ncbi:pseudouridine synthase [Pedobacter sp. AW31-3R]|uniref:pseudouridine synthase n=1 Tax=Pedobacter sp. AW31-3R TaxID=3445781 RepID=UPI003F9F77A5
MTNNNNRNSRDDKSKPGNRSTTGRGRSGAESAYKGKGKFDDKEGKDNNKFGGSKDFKARPPKDGDRNNFRPRSTGGSSEGTSDFKSRPPRDGERSSFKPRNAEGASDFKSRTPRDGDQKSFAPRGAGAKNFKPRAFKEGSSKEMPRNESRSYVKKDNYGTDGERPFRTFDDKKSNTSRSTDSRPFRKREDGPGSKPFSKDRPYAKDRSDKAPVMRSRKESTAADDGKIRLNRYIANSGICSRRKADELIAAGVVSVNGVPVSELGHKVDPSKDEVRYNGELLKREKKIYVILNKPKDYITTTDDPQERRTVMSLVEKASRERIYPVGRLDRNTTGLLLMTNDGDLADKLSHPKNGITKIYHVELSKGLSQGDLNKIQFGLELEDGLIKPDSVSYVAGGSKREVGIQIHSGKNRIVRRIFEHLGYDVVKLDRVVYGNLTKKDLPRGRWRYLEEHELIQIKHLIK